MFRIAGYLHGLQLSRMPLMYHELVIFTIVLFATLNLMNGIKLYLQHLCGRLSEVPVHQSS